MDTGGVPSHPVRGGAACATTTMTLPAALIPTLSAVLAAALAVGAPAARADETAPPPAHLAAYNLAWLNYLDPADQPANPKAVCIVDSGVAVTPDTPADDPVNGPVLARLSTDGGPGEPQGNAPEQLHGTHMAAAAIAPQNGWGTIGTWTGGRIVSVRAMTNNANTFTSDGYRRGVLQCEKTGLAPHIAVVSLSLGCGGLHVVERRTGRVERRDSARPSEKHVRTSGRRQRCWGQRAAAR